MVIGYECRKIMIELRPLQKTFRVTQPIRRCKTLIWHKYCEVLFENETFFFIPSYPPYVLLLYAEDRRESPY